ncbi:MULTISPECIES: 23S rRNA (guanine(745)-N(1))-methyltransferase [unclassified Tatumella]|uniref:23S rRNA (guanine(745)-N(1))-methyltransferase n=1 Tax=unclassified Tatumella TaxID=2649542 RepID=UPI001BAEE897|nr:23S rRNA (guanine(745)-N(1))-methyltransferase [Tatumella sp. JGM82]MBS0889379.1 23S rRNA (guanine(745)-N(1))-methyltransferase [Tatumella sp. JGM94]MBS0901649.1 23S rRNA (guanine(745)-N(1))-methyltransferase [Tatumella sp. JGM100]
MYICPLCHQLLQQQNGGWHCASNHHFDQAKEGYVNLLPVQHKGSKTPGDSPEMMQARRCFLEQGHYQPMQQAVTKVLAEHLPQPDVQILDIGCGEGYYTADIARHFGTRPDAAVFGLDVARVAIKSAAKRYKNIRFCVASSYRLPFADHSLSAVLRIYAPCKDEELARTIMPGGYLLTVTPGPRHLQQLKALIYSEVQLHEDREHPLAEFVAVKEQRLNYPMTLDADAATALLQMTPFAWRASPEVWQTLADSDNFHCAADFCLRLWQRKPL